MYAAATPAVVPQPTQPQQADPVVRQTQATPSAIEQAPKSVPAQTSVTKPAKQSKGIGRMLTDDEW